MDDAWMKKMMGVINKGSSGNRDDMRWVDVPSAAKVKLKFRILPGWGDRNIFSKLVWKHYEVDGSKCLKTWDMDCPICKVISSYGTDNDFINRLNSSAYAYFNAQVPDSSKYNENLSYALRISSFFLTWLIENMMDTEFGVPDAIDPVKGRDIIIWRKRDKGAFERQFSSDGPRPIAETQEGINEILSTMYDFDKIFKIAPSDDVIKEVTDTARILKDRIERKLNSSFSGSSKSNKKTEVQEQKPTNTLENDLSTQNTQNAKCKECMGEYDGSKGSCVLCPYSIECKTKTNDKDDIPF